MHWPLLSGSRSPRATRSVRSAGTMCARGELSNLVLIPRGVMVENPKQDLRLYRFGNHVGGAERTRFLGHV